MWEINGGQRTDRSRCLLRLRVNDSRASNQDRRDANGEFCEVDRYAKLEARRLVGKEYGHDLETAIRLPVVPQALASAALGGPVSQLVWRCYAGNRRA